MASWAPQTGGPGYDLNLSRRHTSPIANTAHYHQTDINTTHTRDKIRSRHTHAHTYTHAQNSYGTHHPSARSSPEAALRPPPPSSSTSRINELSSFARSMAVRPSLFFAWTSAPLWSRISVMSLCGLSLSRCAMKIATWSGVEPHVLSFGVDLDARLNELAHARKVAVLRGDGQGGRAVAVARIVHQRLVMRAASRGCRRGSRRGRPARPHRAATCPLRC